MDVLAFWAATVSATAVCVLPNACSVASAVFSPPQAETRASMAIATAISAEREAGAREIIRAGEIAFWPDGDAIAIGFGPTPLSRDGEIRLASPCNIWALALDDVRQLKSVYAGERIAVIEADS